MEQKESYRWYEEAARAAQRDQGAASYTVVADREADIYELLVLLTTLGFVIRSFQNRRLSGQPQDKMQYKLDAEPVHGQYQLAVPATDKRSAHTAELEVKWGQLDLARPRSGTGTKHLAKDQPVMVIEVKEQASSVVGKEKPIYWRLLTSHAVNDMEDALRIIQYYVQRWIIEQVFRTLKKKGMDMCSAQVGNAHALKNLTALCLITAVQVMQLVQAREQPKGLPIRAAFDTERAKVIQRLSTSLEGVTDKLKNPYPTDSLAFATWVIARLGGWSGYISQRPPGPITIWNGLQRLNQICEGLTLLDLGYSVCWGIVPTFFVPNKSS